MRLLGTEQSTWATDARLALPAAAAWLGAAVALSFPGIAPPAAGTLALLGALLLIVRRSAVVVTVAALLCCAAAAVGSAAVHAAAAAPAVLTRAAAAGMTGQVELVVTDDPMPVTRPVAASRGRPLVRFSARLTRLETAGRSTRLRAPVFVLAPADGWSHLLPSQSVRARARLAPAQPGELLGALVLPRAPPADVGPPGRLQRAAGTIRAGLHRGVEPLPSGPAALLPGLVVGDTSRLRADVVAEFRATGLSHLVAVSGANLAIVVGTVLAAARRLGAGRRLAGVLAGLVMVGFVIVARPTPSVLRAAVMSAVVLVGLQEGRRSAAMPALAAATFGLVLVDPSLARAPGFALSVLATAGIVLFAVPLRSRMPGWLPGWLAEALAVPLAAQLACTPVLVLLFGQLSLIAVPANLLAAPAVPPATVVGVLVGITAPVVLPVAQLLARLAQLPASWLLLVAHSGAGLPGAQLSWPSGASGAALAVVATAAGVVVIRRRMLRAMAAVALVSALVAVGGLTRLSPAWPPAGWALVACDVGQGDGLVLAVGSGTAVVVDAGPDPVAMDRCLQALGVRHVALVILSHLHADHVEGLPGVLRNRRVGAIQIGPLEEPPEESARVRRWAAGAAVPLLPAVDGENRSTGLVSWQVIAPTRPFRGTDSDPNNSSIVVRVQLAGFTALLTGDIEIAAQQELVASGKDLSADVLKVAHHGSGRQVPAFLDRVRPRLAVASVGADNDYGHPTAVTMAGLAAAGSHAFRTDRDGAVAFLRRGGAVVGVGRRGSGLPPAGPRLAGRLPDLPAADGTADSTPDVPSDGTPDGTPDGTQHDSHREAPWAAQAPADGAGSGFPAPVAGSPVGVAASPRPRLPWRFPQRPTRRVQARCRSPPAAAARAGGPSRLPPDILATVSAAPPQLTLVVGDEELLVERAIAAVTSAARAAAADAEITDAPVSSITADDLVEMLSPGLFGGPRCLILRDAQDAGKGLAADLPRLLGAADDAHVVVTHNGGARGKALLDELIAEAGAVIRCGRVSTARERADFVTAEVNAAGRRIDPAGVAALLASVGTDLRELANVCAQLTADTTGTIGASAVARYTSGRADATGFTVADRAVEGDLGGALEVLRWAMAVGVAPVLVTSSLAANLRLIARVAGEGRGQPTRIARVLGQPGWKVDKALRWSRGWTPAGLSAAVRAVATADGEVKGGAVDAGYAVERAVRNVAAARQLR